MEGQGGGWRATRTTGERLGRRVAPITRRLKDGTPYDVERIAGR